VKSYKNQYIIFRIFLFGTLLLIQNIAHADTSQSIKELPRISSPIIIDGIADEEAWQQIAPLSVVMYQPVHRGEMTEKTTIKVGYDEKYIYVMGDLYDSEGEKIVANTLYRDKYRGDETFAILLDSYNDNENMKWFYVTPNGVKVDLHVTHDAVGEEPYNRSWNTFWDSAVRKTDKGWFVEMRIPFSSLGFQEINGDVIMGMITYRYIARKSERHIYPDIPPNWSHGFIKASQAQKIRMHDIKYKRPFYVTPYLLGSFGQVNSLEENENIYSKENDYDLEGGLDIKFPVTGNMNIDLTANTDFAQVEADETQINLTRTPLFFPEKRQFFQERSDIFEFGFSEPNTLFYSRRIGLEQGQHVKILGGARLAGRAGKWDIGMLDMQTKSVPELDIKSRNFGVVRVKRTLFNENSYAGGLITSRIDVDGAYNINSGFDMLYNYSANDFLDIKIASTFDDRFEQNFSFFEKSKIRFNLHRRSVNNFYYHLTLQRIGKRYLPVMGFESRENYKLCDAQLFYGRFLKPDSPLRLITPSLSYFMTLRNKDNSVQSMIVKHLWELIFKNTTVLKITGTWWHENLLSRLYFSEQTFIEPGSYSFFGATLDYKMPVYKPLQTTVSANLSTFYDGRQLSLSVLPKWHQSKYLELSGEVAINYIDIPARNQQEYLNIYRLQALLALNTHVSLQLLSQYNELTRLITTNSRLRYNFSEGNDLWIVYNKTTNAMPALPAFNNRIMIIKYTYTFY